MGAIFISYRRDDTDGHAGRLEGDLQRAFGKPAVFMDVSQIGVGKDFRKVIDEKLGACAVLIAMIGPKWLHIEDDSGRRRLDKPDDFVRIETARALARENIVVIPVRVKGAKMPAAGDLPDDLKDLPYRHGVELRHERWESDVQDLIRELREHVPLLPASAPPLAAASQPGAEAAYLAKFKLVMQDGAVSLLERKTLTELRDRLGLSAAQAEAIEESFERQLQQYRQDLAETLAQAYPLSAATQAELAQRREDLGLAADDVQAMEKELIGAAEARHRERVQAAQRAKAIEIEKEQARERARAQERAQELAKERAKEQASKQTEEDAKRAARERAERKASEAATQPAASAAPSGAVPKATVLPAAPSPAPAAPTAKPTPASAAPTVVPMQSFASAPAAASRTSAADKIIAKANDPALAAGIENWGDRLFAAVAGGGVSFLAALFAAMFGGSVTGSVVGGAIIFGAIVGAVSASYRWVAGFGALVFVVLLLSQWLP